jgi:hypothetical protein
LEGELKRSFRFFEDYTNWEAGPGYGLTSDSTKKPQVGSIAATGFALSAWVIGDRRQWIDRPTAVRRVIGTLETLQTAANHRGFFAHFLDRQTGLRFRQCEYSTIDTALCLNGVVTVMAYFEDPQVQSLGQALLQRVDWAWLVFEREGKMLFHMAYNPDRHGDYVHGEPGFIGQWDMAAEQKMMYFLAAPYLPEETARALYAGFSRDVRTYQGYSVIVNPGGNLFAYHFSEAWFDAARYTDPQGINWADNAKAAALANREFCRSQQDRYPGYATLWGLSASDGPKGYQVSGAMPALHEPHHNGTISVYSVLSSLPYTFKESIAVMETLYYRHPQSYGKYGYVDAINLDWPTPYFSPYTLGIDKGCSMLMIENALTQSIWTLYTQHPLIQQALHILGFQEVPHVQRHTD